MTNPTRYNGRHYGDGYPRPFENVFDEKHLPEYKRAVDEYHKLNTGVRFILSEPFYTRHSGMQVKQTVTAESPRMDLGPFWRILERIQSEKNRPPQTLGEILKSVDKIVNHGPKAQAAQLLALQAKFNKK
jgi:hypothetical protein